MEQANLRPLPREITLGRTVIQPGEAGLLFSLRLAGAVSEQSYSIALPTFEIDGQVQADFYFVGQQAERKLAREGREVILQYGSIARPNLDLRVVVRGYPTAPFIRFRYILSATEEVRLTKTGRQDAICYFSLPGLEPTSDLTEIQLSHFNPLVHSYQPQRETQTAARLYSGYSFTGPLTIFHEADQALLVAYEHGAEQPQAFLEFQLSKEKEPTSLELRLVARQGNYYTGQLLDKLNSWASIWFQAGLTDTGGAEQLIQAYRNFLLDDICEDNASRQPYLFYNTWNYQERNCYFNGKRYLDSMNYERIMSEIELAHRLGLDVFVIDTGWYTKTGDWTVDAGRFPDGLQSIRSRLTEYGMRLGLWFNPTVAALTSSIYRSHPEYVMTTGPKPTWQDWVWETEESIGMCLVSEYAAYFIEKLVSLHHSLGVSYFKWDGISQWGCDSPLHQHGNQSNSAEERAECYAYGMGRVLIGIVEEVTRQCPGVIVDFDVTEGGRFMGLGFLAVGKYFLVNNGPYFSDFDLPATTRIEPATINAFFYPGPARSRICRQGIKYDFLIPSILFLTHYLPDGPVLSQANALAALMLGGNGLWGDLPGLSETEVALLAHHLTRYKQLAQVITHSYPVIYGFPGSSPEIYEKLDPLTGQGLLVVFTVAPGHFTHVTGPIKTPTDLQIEGADKWAWLPDGRLEIQLSLAASEARIIYFLRV